MDDKKCCRKKRQVSRPMNWEDSYYSTRDKYGKKKQAALPEGADPKKQSRVSKAVRPGVVRQRAPSAVRIIKSIQGHLNEQGCGVELLCFGLQLCEASVSGCE